MELRLDGKTALVTGGVRRVGRAIALELARAGARIVVHESGLQGDQRPDDLLNQLRSLSGREPVHLVCDLRATEGADQLMDAAYREVGSLDILVSNAALFQRKPFVEVSEAEWEQMLGLNFHAPRRLARRFSEESAKTIRTGTIVHLLDIAAAHAWRGYSHYCVSKAALLMLTRVLALELAPSIRVVGVAPGVAEFPESMSEADRQRVISLIPMGRAGTSEDVAQTVRFLVAGPDYLNGVVIGVDGGRSAGSVHSL